MAFSFLHGRGWPLPIGIWARKKRQLDVTKWPHIFANTSGKIKGKRTHKNELNPVERYLWLMFFCTFDVLYAICGMIEIQTFPALQRQAIRRLGWLWSPTG